MNSDAPGVRDPVFLFVVFVHHLFKNKNPVFFCLDPRFMSSRAVIYVVAAVFLVPSPLNVACFLPVPCSFWRLSFGFHAGTDPLNTPTDEVSNDLNFLYGCTHCTIAHKVALIVLGNCKWSLFCRKAWDISHRENVYVANQRNEMYLVTTIFVTVFTVYILMGMLVLICRSLCCSLTEKGGTR